VVYYFEAEKNEESVLVRFMKPLEEETGLSVSEENFVLGKNIRGTR